MILVRLFQILAFVSLVPAATHKTWFSFGDSYTTTGFNITTGPLPSLGNPLGNPAYPGYTGGGGENWVDYLTTQYNSTKVLTYNFAYGGATIDSDLVTPYLPTVLSLKDQVNEFIHSLRHLPAWKSSAALFSVWIGINDVGNSYFLEDQDTFTDVLMDAYFDLVEQLYVAAGARNFLFVNVPPIDRSPLMLAEPLASQELESTVITTLFNKKVAERVKELKATHRGVTTYLWDSHTSFTKMLDDPTTYGFVDATTFGEGPGIFWGNNYHPSSYAHKFFAQDVARVLHKFL